MNRIATGSSVLTALGTPAIAQQSANKIVLRWNPEKSVGVYNVYREPISSLPGAGTCLARGLQVTNYNEPTVPLSGTGYYYLITAENRLGEEGTKGFRSSGTERSNAFACP
jgi:hypothetical protein